MEDTEREIPTECPRCGRDLRIPLEWTVAILAGEEPGAGQEEGGEEWSAVWTKDREEVRPVEAGDKIEKGTVVQFVDGRYAGRVGTVLNWITPDRILVEVLSEEGE